MEDVEFVLRVILQATTVTGAEFGEVEGFLLLTVDAAEVDLHGVGVGAGVEGPGPGWGLVVGVGRVGGWNWGAGSRVGVEPGFGLGVWGGDKRFSLTLRLRGRVPAKGTA